MSKMRFVAAILIILVPAYVDAMLISDTERTGNELHADDGNVTCNCYGSIKVESLSRMHLNGFFLGMVGMNSEIEKYPTISRMLRECSNCSARIITCKTASRKYTRCIEREVIMKDTYNSERDLTGGFLTEDIKTLQNAVKDSSGRKPRDYQGLAHCTFPKNMKTSYLTCTEYPSSVKCKQKCIFGFTLDEGITREMKCSVKENVWRPRGFQECSPFVDCTMTLVGPGWKSCRFGTLYEPSECSASCERYEDKDAVPSETYICDVNKGWSKKLPHCIQSGSGFATVPAPRVKLHNPQSESEPEPPKPKKRPPPEVPKVPVPKKEETQKTLKTVSSSSNPKQRENVTK